MATKVVTLSEARKVLTNSFDNQRLDLLEKTYNEVKEFQLCEMSVTLYNHDSGNVELHKTTLTIQTVPFKITLAYSNQFKKYSVFADFKELANVDKYAIERVSNTFTTPNQIGKLSAKKVGEWIAYHTAIFNVLKKENESNASEKDAFLKSIEGLPVKWNGTDKKRGSIVQNGIELTFEIGETSVSKRIALYYAVSSSVENFIALSANNYKG